MRCLILTSSIVARKYNATLMDKLCLPPPSLYVEMLIPIPEKMTGFGNRAF